MSKFQKLNELLKLYATDQPNTIEASARLANYIDFLHWFISKNLNCGKNSESVEIVLETYLRMHLYQKSLELNDLVHDATFKQMLDDFNNRPQNN